MKRIKEKNWLKNPTVEYNLPVLKVKLDHDITCSSLLDTGSSLSFISKNMVNKLIKKRLIKKIYAEEVKCYSACGNVLNLLGKCYIKIKIGHFSWKVPFFIVNDFKWEMLLGVNFVKQSQLLIDLSSNEISFKFQPEIKISLEKCASISVNNVNNEQMVGTPEARARIEGLINKYSNVFTNKIGKSLNMQYQIKLTSDEVINLKPYPLSPPRMKQVKEIIDELMSEGVIEPSTSPYSSPCFLVGEKENPRLVINYAKLNKIVERVAFPLGDMTDIFHHLRGARYFSVIDLKKSFYQIELTEDSKKYTAFSTNYASFQFTRIPFGMSIGSNLLSSALSELFYDIMYKSVLRFVDDILVYSPTLEQHLLDLEEVFSRLSREGFTANPKKMKLAYTEISYLGMLISHNNIRIDPARTEKIRNYPRPKNVKEVGRFIGMVNFFSKNISNYAQWAASLNNLRKKRTKFVWTEECEESFQKLKYFISNPPILAMADFSKPFILHCDASSLSLGSCLIQEGPNNERRPIAYYSRKFTDSELSLSIYQKELLSIVCSIEKFHKFLEHQSFELICDNQALSWVLSHFDKLGKLGRWVHRILALPFHIKHVKSELNPVADALSRMYSMDDPNRPKIEFIEVDELPSNGISDISKDIKQPKLIKLSNQKAEVNIISDCPLIFTELGEHQKNDPEIQRIVHSIKNKTNKDNFYLKNDVLMYKEHNGSKGRVYLPKDLIGLLFKYFHCSLIGGHLSQERTAGKICENFYRPGLKQMIKNLVRKCQTCIKAKPTQRTLHGPLVATHGTRPLNVLYADLVGPLVRSKQGYNNILVISDDVSKYTFLIPLRNSTTKAVISKINEIVIQNFSIPKTIVTDSGSCFRSIEFTNYCFRLGIEHRKTIGYMPSSNRCERANRNLVNQLKCYFHSKHNDWSNELYLLQLSLNSAINESTKYTAHELMFSFPFSEPLTNVWNLDEIVDRKCTPEQIVNKLDQAVSNLKNSVKKNQEREMYSNKYSKYKYKINDIVYVKTYPISKKIAQRQKKFDFRFEGPYKIIFVNNAVSYIVQNCNNPSDTRKVHISQLKVPKLADENN